MTDGCIFMHVETAIHISYWPVAHFLLVSRKFCSRRLLLQVQVILPVYAATFYKYLCGDTGKNFSVKIVNIFLPINFSICFGCSKEPSH